MLYSYECMYVIRVENVVRFDKSARRGLENIRLTVRGVATGGALRGGGRVRRLVVGIHRRRHDYILSEALFHFGARPGARR